MKTKRAADKQIARVSGSSLQSERLISYSLLFAVLCHTLSCGWILISKLQSFDESTWVTQHGYQHASPLEQYMAGLYFIVATITTVGYGDITSGYNPIEQAFSIALMVIGALSYSAAISTIMSLMSEMDQRAQRLRHKLQTLARIKDEYKLDFELYWRLRRSLHFDHALDMGEKSDLLNELPAHLKVELTNIMYSQQLQSIDFFKRKSPKFIATVAPLLKPLKVCKGEHIFLQGDTIDGIYFIKSGEAAYVEPRGEADLTFAHIYSGSFFGDVDFTASTSVTESKRLFSVKALTDMDLLFLSKEDLFEIDIEFKSQVFKLFTKSHRKAEKLNRILARGQQWLELQQLSKQSPLHSPSQSFKEPKKKSPYQQPMIRTPQTPPTLQESHITIQPVRSLKQQPLKRQITFHRRKSVRKALDRQLTLSSVSHRSQLNNNSKQFLDVDSSASFLLGDSFLSQQSSRLTNTPQTRQARRPSQFLKELDKIEYNEDKKTEEQEQIQRDIPDHFSYTSSSSESETEERQATVKRKDNLIDMLSSYD